MLEGCEVVGRKSGETGDEFARFALLPDSGPASG